MGDGESELDPPGFADVYMLAATNAVVRAVLQRWRRGELVWADAMMLAVVELAKQNDALMDTILKDQTRRIGFSVGRIPDETWAGLAEGG